MRQDAAMPLTREQLDAIVATTLAHYDENAEEFWRGTRDHDVSQNVAALLRHLEGTLPFAILDLGCGPGRDLKMFRDLGHQATGVEGSLRLAAMARAWSGCEVWQQNLLALDLPPARFDGVFANAVLFHVPGESLARVLGELHATLKPAACCSARTRAATAAKAGTAGVSAPITTGPRGRAISTPVVRTIWDELVQPYSMRVVRRPAPSSAAPEPAPTVVIGGRSLPAPSEGEPIPAGRLWWLSATPDNRVWTDWSDVTRPVAPSATPGTRR